MLSLSHSLLFASPPLVWLCTHCYPFFLSLPPFFLSLPKNKLISTVHQFPPPTLTSFPLLFWLTWSCVNFSCFCSHNFLTISVFSLKKRSVVSSALPVPSSPKCHLLLSFFLPSTKNVIFHSSTNSHQPLLRNTEATETECQKPFCGNELCHDKNSHDKAKQIYKITTYLSPYTELPLKEEMWRFTGRWARAAWWWQQSSVNLAAG